MEDLEPIINWKYLITNLSQLDRRQLDGKNISLNLTPKLNIIKF